MSDNNHIQEIILRYLNGESSKEESAILEQWIAESESNAQEFEVIKKLWTNTSEAALIPVDTDKAWDSVSARTMGKEAKIVKLFAWKKAIAIAASIIIIAGIFYFYLQPSAIVWKDTLAQNDNKRIQLSEGTVITLRKGSKLSLPENYGKNIRQVRLEGEAFFEVTHDTQNPFSVITPKSIIKDIGTAFLVQSLDSTEQVTVTEGEVSFNDKKESKTPVVLRAGESAILKNEIPQRKIIDTSNLLSWESKTLIFNNTPLSLVTGDLENYYKVDIEVTGSLDSIQITAAFRDEPLEQVLKELRLFTGLNFKLEGRRVLVSK